MMHRLLLTIAAMGAATAAFGAVPRAGETILAGCRQGQCAWLKVGAVAPPQRSPQGMLRRLTVQRGRSVHLDGALPNGPREARIEWERPNRNVYAFCSTRRPAYAFENEEGALLLHFLDPFDLAGYQYASAGMYMRLCHGVARLPSPAAMRRLGYRPGTRSEQVENGTVATLTRF